MNWVRGIFRLWLVLSTLWVVGLYFLTTPYDRYQAAQNRTFDLVYEGEILEFPKWIENDELEAALVRHIKEERKKRAWNTDQVDAILRAKQRQYAPLSIDDLFSELKKADDKGKLQDAMILAGLIKGKQDNPLFGDIPLRPELKYTEYSAEKSASLLIGNRPPVLKPFKVWREFGLLAFIPPAIALLLGLACSWIFKGFRRT